MNKSEEEYKFIDIEEKNYNQIIKSYMSKNKINFDNLLKNKEELRELVISLRNKEKISYRNIERELGISRETLRKLVK